MWTAKMSRQAPMALTHGSQASAGCPSPPLSQPHRRHHHRQQQQQQQQQEERSPGPPDPQPEWATADRNPPGSRSAIAVRMYIVRTSCGCGLVSCPPSQPSSVSRTYRRREKAKKRRTQKARRTDEPHRQGSQQRPRPRPQQSLHGCVGHPPPVLELTVRVPVRAGFPLRPRPAFGLARTGQSFFFFLQGSRAGMSNRSELALRCGWLGGSYPGEAGWQCISARAPSEGPTPSSSKQCRIAGRRRNNGASELPPPSRPGLANRPERPRETKQNNPKRTETNGPRDPRVACGAGVRQPSLPPSLRSPSPEIDAAWNTSPPGRGSP